jgi:hypothetical protein
MGRPNQTHRRCSSLAGRFVHPCTRPARRVRRASPTRLPDFGPLRLPVAICNGNESALRPRPHFFGMHVQKCGGFDSPSVGPFGLPALARRRPVKGVTLTGFPDLGRGRPSIRCDIHVASALEFHLTDHIQLGGQSWCVCTEPVRGLLPSISALPRVPLLSRHQLPAPSVG